MSKLSLGVERAGKVPGTRYTESEAREYSEGLGLIGAGWWRQIAWAHQQGIPLALGLTTREWVQQFVGGWQRFALPDRRTAVLELTTPAEEGGFGLSQRAAADVLGVSDETVRRDVAATNVAPEAEPDAATEPPPATNVALPRPTPAFPAGQYAILLADPPWRYEFAETTNRAIENQYPTLDVGDITAFRDGEGRSVNDVATPDAALFLWATNPKLPEAMAVIEAWGFRYVSNRVWVKDVIGMGYWARQQHELLLIATRGHISPPPPELRPPSLIDAPRGSRHSAKPTSVQEWIEFVWPDHPKIDIFARKPRAGWATFGNEV